METILIVDDTKINIQILIELLGDKYDCLVATNGKDALETLEDEKVDLILLDIMMPQMDGFEVCNKIKSNPYTKDIPIIFITAKTDEDSIEKAYDIGGSDYVIKPFRPKELMARVKRELELLSLQNELKVLASTDSMTKLYNRGYFKKVSTNIFDIARRDKKTLCVIMMDIDKFKDINDTYGHSVGDDVIVHTAKLLSENHRKSDLLCRYGGEEFAILLQETTIEKAVLLAQKTRENLENSIINLQDGTQINYTGSFGVAEVCFEKEDNIENALNKADKALYEAKQSGRNLVRVY